MAYGNIEQLANHKTWELAYFNLRTAILRNNQKSIEYNRNLLTEIEKFSPEIMEEIDPYYISEFQKIIKILETNSLPFSFNEPVGNEDETMEIFDNKYLQYEKEEILRDQLFQYDFNLINEAIGEDLKPIGIEVPTNYGKIDILAQNDNGQQKWIIELKKGKGQFPIISQVAKYILSQEEKLINKSFKEVKSITIANGYSSFALQGLRKMGCIPLHYEQIANKLITLKRV